MPFDLATRAGGSGTMTELRTANNNALAIRRTLKIAVLAAPMTVDVPDTIFGTDGTITLPAGVFGVGLIDPKGVVLKPKTTKDEITSLGEGTTRTDVTDVARELSVTIQESYRKDVMQLMLGQDLSKVGVSSTGEIVIDEESVPIGASYRLFCISYDINKANGKAILDARVFTNASLSEVPGLTLAEKGAKDYDLGFDILTDTDLGTHCRTFIGGPGMTELHPVLGWGPAAAAA